MELGLELGESVSALDGLELGLKVGSIVGFTAGSLHSRKRFDPHVSMRLTQVCSQQSPPSQSHSAMLYSA